MTQTDHKPHTQGQVIGTGGRMLVFEPPADGNRRSELEQLAGLLDEETICFMGKGRLGLAALAAADKASAASIRIVLEAPDGMTVENLSWAGQSATIQRSDILILTGSATAPVSGASARLAKSCLPRATLMFVHGAADDVARDRPGPYREAVQDFLRRGSRFVIRC